MGSSLYVEVPGEPPFEVRLDKDLISVGRSEENVLGLRDMNVSRLHFVIERRAQTWLVRDRGSRNGTLVNRQPVYDKVLRDGDRIEVGGSSLTFRAQASRLSISTDEAPRPRPTPGTPGAPPQPSPAPPSRETKPAQAPQLGAFASRTPPVEKPPEPAPVRPTPSPVPHAPRQTAPMPVMTLPGTPMGGTTRPMTPSAPPTPNTSMPRPVPTPGPTRHMAPVPPTPTTPGEPEQRTVPKGARNLGSVADLVENARVPGRLAPASRGDSWKKLAEVAAAINQEHDLTRLLESVVDAVLSLVPSRGAFLVCLEEERLKLKVARNFDARALDDPNGVYRLSYQTCREAIASKRPILTRDSQHELALASFASISNLKLGAILCVPFGVGAATAGVVYLDDPVIETNDVPADLIDIVTAFGDLAGIAFANARHLEEVKRRERLSEELKIASRIQRKLLPESAPVVPGLEIAGRTIPAEEVGGDLYDFFMGPQGEVFISIGDVSGKGAGAGIVMASARSLFRAYSERESRTDRLLVAVNRGLVRDLEKGSFVSILLLRYEPGTRKLAFAGAGHEHLLVLRAKGGDVERLRSGGVVLGLAPDIEGKVEERPLELGPGDVVVLYTDGATEAASPEGEELGLDRLAALVAEGRGKSPADMVKHVIDGVHRFVEEGHAARDDLTVVALRRS